MSPDVDEPASRGCGARSRSRTDGRETAADGEHEECCDHGDDEPAPAAAELSFFLQLLAAVNISLFLFNLLPIPPLDGGQIFPAIWEAIKKRGARVLGRPDPGPVDVAKLMPVAYVVALVFIAWSGLLFVADIINPVVLPQ